jgi:cysteinyl-tRNA synthetase
MSKRFGNFTTPRDLKADGVDPGAFRLLVFQTHYRQKLDLTDEALAAAQEGSRRLGEFAARLGQSATETTAPTAAAFDRWANGLETGVRDALDDDLNAPQAMAAVFEAVREGNRLLDQGLRPHRTSHAGVWDRLLGVLDVLPDPAAGAAISVGPPGRADLPEAVDSDAAPADPAQAEVWAKGLALARLSARGRRDYKEADRIRDALEAAGWEIRDNKDGTANLRRKPG